MRVLNRDEGGNMQDVMSWSPRELATRVDDAYMTDRYGEGAWLRVCRFLKDEGFSEAEAEAVLRSKHMRWAHDAKLTNGEPNSADFKRYYEKNEARIRMDAEECS
jgi:hypothetical protein